MSKERLQKVIDNFSESTLIHFFRECGKFAEAKESLPQFNSDKFTGFQRLGTIEFDDRKKLVVVIANSVNDLIERSGKKAQYDIAKKILKEFNVYYGGIFVYYDSDHRFRFSLIYTESEDVKIKFSNFRRFTYFVSRDQTNNTFRIRVGGCNFSSLEAVKDAFSVEKVTKEFYKQIADWYFWAVQNVTFPKDAETEANGRNNAAIRLITRLIFIWFMKERKLVSPGLFNQDNIAALLKSLKPDETTYYKAILQNLFFATLNTQIEERKFRFADSYHGKNKDYMEHGIYRYEDYFKNQEDMLVLFKDIPFLNGGLFDCLDWSAKESRTGTEVRFDGFSDKEVGLNVPNYLFFSGEKEANLNKEYGTKNKKYSVHGLLNILSAYNFTIDENDPNDQEVALDPELLGKVFENLLASFNPETATTARKATGSYNTPREIVDYMVTQSLKQYYKTHLSDVADIDNKLDELLSPITEEPVNPFGETDSKRVVRLTEELRIVDPAVGSGAFPMGILNKLVAVLARVDHNNRLWQEAQLKAVEAVTDQLLKQKLIKQINEQFAEKNSNYGRKLYLIQKCIYGVDIQQIAVEIAKLRFFIALLVDERIDKSKQNWGIVPLPNLDFKLMQGNSLISEFRGINLDAEDSNSYGKLMKDETDELITQYQNKKSAYQYEPDRDKKEALKSEIEKIIAQIFESKLQSQKAEYLTKLKNIERKYAAVPNTQQRDESIKIDTETLNKNYSFDLAQAEKQLKEFTSGQKVKPIFAWKLYFAEVFHEKGGFDVVIANPPYVSMKKFPKDVPSRKYKDYLLENYRTFASKSDLYCCFFEKSLGSNSVKSILRNEGILTFICSSTFFCEPSFQKLRELMLNNQILLLSVPRGDVFESSLVNTAVVSIKEDAKHMPGIIGLYEIDKDRKISKTGFIEQEALKKIGLFLKNNSELVINILEKFGLLSPQNQFLNLKNILTINNGIATADNDLWLYEKNNYSSEESWLSNKAFKNKKNVKDFYRGETVRRWFISKPNSRINYLPDLMKKHRSTARPKTPDFFETRKLVSQLVGEELRVAYDDVGRYFDINVNLIYPKTDSYDLKFILSFLNSKLLNFVLDNLRSNISLTLTLLYKIPILRLSSREQEPFIGLVDQILAITKDEDYLTKPAKQVKVQEYERQIDQMVYELYGLTPEEIAVVEGEVK